MIGVLAAGSAAGGIAAGIVILVIVALVVVRSVLIVVTEYERGVFFRFGRILQGAKGPGIIRRGPVACA